MSGSKYKTAMSQMENQGILNPDVKMFFNESVEKQPTIVSTIMTQISLKAVIKQWGKKARESVN